MLSRTPSIAQPMPLRTSPGRRPLTCRTCGYTDETRVFACNAWRPPHWPFLTCPKCGNNPERAV